MTKLEWKETTVPWRKVPNPYLRFEGFAEPCTSIVLCRVDVGGTFLGPPPQPSKWVWVVSMPRSLDEVRIEGGDHSPDEAQRLALATLIEKARRVVAELEAAS